MAQSLIKATDISVRSKTHLVFEHVDFDWKPGQHWAIIGPNGSGKSAFLQTMLGKMNVCAGEISRPFADPHREAETHFNAFFSFHNLMQLVDIRHDFRNRSNLRQFYYQQRYNASEADEARSVAEHLADHEVKVARETHWTIDRVKERLGLEKLWDKSLIKLSNGESKRLRLATALLQNPLILLLDNTFAGLDPHTRQYFEEVLKEIAEHGTHVALVTTPDEIPSIITDVLVFDECRMIHNLPRAEYQSEWHYPKHPINIDMEQLVDVVKSKVFPKYETIARMTDAHVHYGENTILNHVNWTIKPGEHWALCGSNGSGKSTLLSLLYGDHPQAYACDLHLFDRKRGSGESIWDIKQNIGFMSPELYQFFPSSGTCLQIVISGFYDILTTHQKGTAEQQEAAAFWLNLLDLSAYLHTPLADMPASKQRLCLLARSLVKIPSLLILDEPCQGLDREHQQKFREIIDLLAANTPMAIVYVTHYHEELPSCIDREIRLE